MIILIAIINHRNPCGIISKPYPFFFIHKYIIDIIPIHFIITLIISNNVIREQMLNEVWGSNYLGETRTIDVHIGQLRRKLDLSDVIKTIPKIGYRLEE